MLVSRFALMTLLLFVVLALAPRAMAQAPGAAKHVAIRMVAETDRPAPGSSVLIALISAPEPGWHTYWANPGDAGFATRTQWTLPAGVTAGTLRYPVPERLLIAGLMNYVFEAPYALLVPVAVPEGLAPGTPLPIRLTLDYPVCTAELCVPEKAELAATLAVGNGKVSPERRAEFDRYRAALPRPLGSTATFQSDGGRFRLAIPYPAGAEIDDAYFYPLTDRAIDYAAPQTITRDGDRLVIETAAKGAPPSMEGVLRTGPGRGLALRATPGTVAAAASAPAAGTAPPWQAALIAFAGAILGGLILNVMPCVFPILSLKALSLAKANQNAGRPRSEALAYAAGVILTCLALGGTLLALRAAGSSVGWAFQLQDPRVILLLLLMVTGIAFNLAGLFELEAPGVVNRAAARGTGGAFFTGALAAFIATPCTGPFMGAALGSALVLPWPAALAVFAGLGLGIALPFLLIGFVPALRRALPRPGPWMATLRNLLAIPMFATALALAWVLGGQAGIDGLTLGLGAALLLALALWWVGKRQARGLHGSWLLPLPLILAALGAIALVRPAAEASAPASARGAEPFTEARLAALRAEGRPVFAYFTADWCLTCKVNEGTVIDTEATRGAFRAANVAVLVGDWTDGDPALGRFLEANGRAGVPLYLWYMPGEPTPRVLPQVLTQAMLAELAGRAGNKAGG